MTTKQEKRKYVKPAIQVYELRQMPQLLAASKPDYIPEEW